MNTVGTELRAALQEMRTAVLSRVAAARWGYINKGRVKDLVRWWDDSTVLREIAALRDVRRSIWDRVLDFRRSR